MRDATIAGFMEELAARVPAPAGGAVAALHAAQAAALLAMVARYTDGERFAEYQPTIRAVMGEADSLRSQALRLADQDIAAFTAVGDAYRLPKATDAERAARSAAIAHALIGAAAPPAAVITAAGRLVELAETLLPIANRNVIADLAAAAQAARAATATSRVNVEANLAGVTDPAARERLGLVAAGAGEWIARADRITAVVRGEVGS